jgi:nucleoid-associated protein YgaU
MTQRPNKIEEGKDYIVQAGDTRESIAMRAYDDPRRWELIKMANIEELKDLGERHLPPGMVLHIPAEGGHGGGNIHPPSE